MKRKLGLKLNLSDCRNMLMAIEGINASRLYPLGYEFIYESTLSRPFRKKRSYP